jgi:AcrR family transcriptional regulator
VERLSERDYFEVGMDLLAEGGLASVTIANLCERLGVTKGSFYHHFVGGPDFQQRLLTYWAEDRAAQLIEMVEATPNPLDRITMMKHMGVELHHEAESAIRAWARSDPRAAETQRRVDAERERALTEALSPPAFRERRRRRSPRSASPSSSAISNRQALSTASGWRSCSTSTSHGWRRRWFCPPNGGPGRFRERRLT